MKILAFELSTARGSLAWKLQDRLLEKTWPNDRKHSGSFFENLNAGVREFGLPGTIVIGLGPGSYAGVRIAISAAIGLQSASDARLIGAPSICAMEGEARTYYTIGDARRQSYFLARIEENQLVDQPELLSEAELKTRLATIDDLPLLSSDPLPQFPGVRSSFPSAARLALLAANENQAFALPPLEPMYLREPHITVPKNRVTRTVK
jgi:tRNA threonylcarbamoyladenosine biosynthesis protein TsaB